MTRQKKSRSLKRIHNVKTGSVSKLKKQAAADRQTGKRIKKRTPSVYEKYVAEHPEARLKDQQTQHNKPKESEAASQDLEAEQQKQAVPEREPSLLDELDRKDFKDIY